MRTILITAVFGITCLAGGVLVSGDPPLTRSTVANSGDIPWPLSADRIGVWTRLSAMQPREQRGGGRSITCRDRTFSADGAGEYAVNGNPVSFIMRQRSPAYRDTCNPSLNSNKNLPLEERAFPYRIVRGQYGKPHLRYARAR
ncbi:MAG: hypothetical protein HYX27_07525 [Acidobacteria bacterium]|nr:hypothetical protein [Acidobacteriota bacterium]